MDVRQAYLCGQEAMRQRIVKMLSHNLLSICTEDAEEGRREHIGSDRASMRRHVRALKLEEYDEV